MELMVRSRDDLREILGHIEIASSFTHAMPKLGWEIQEVEEAKIAEHNPSADYHVTMGWLINYTYERPDTFSGAIGIGRGRQELVRYSSTESQVVKTVWILLELLVRHELMEAFQYYGHRVFNPHHSVGDLVNACVSWEVRSQREEAHAAAQ